MNHIESPSGGMISLLVLFVEFVSQVFVNTLTSAQSHGESPLEKPVPFLLTVLLLLLLLLAIFLLVSILCVEMITITPVRDILPHTGPGLVFAWL